MTRQRLVGHLVMRCCLTQWFHFANRRCEKNAENNNLMPTLQAGLILTFLGFPFYRMFGAIGARIQKSPIFFFASSSLPKADACSPELRAEQNSISWRIQLGTRHGPLAAYNPPRRAPSKNDSFQYACGNQYKIGSGTKTAVWHPLITVCHLFH